MALYTRNYKKFDDDKSSSPFSTALRFLMAKESTTQEVLAKVTGKTRQTVSQYVNGISEPSYETLVKIADYYDVSVDFLLGRTQDSHRFHSIADDIGLSPEVISLLRSLEPFERRLILDGINLLLADREMLHLAANIELLRRDIKQQLDSSLLEKITRFPRQKFLQSFDECYIPLELSDEIRKWIKNNYPEYESMEFEVIVGQRSLTIRKREIVDNFDEIVRNIVDYNRFRREAPLFEDFDNGE